MNNRKYLLGIGALPLMFACSPAPPNQATEHPSDGPASPPSVLTVLCSSGAPGIHVDENGARLADCSGDGPLVTTTTLACKRGAVSGEMLVGQKAAAFCDEGVRPPTAAEQIPAPSPQRPDSLTFLCSTRDAWVNVDYATNRLKIRCPEDGPLETTTAFQCKQGWMKTWIEGGERVSVRCVPNGNPAAQMVLKCPRGKAKSRMTGDRSATIYCDEG